MSGKVAEGIDAVTASAKIKDLARDTVDVNNGTQQTTDFGQGISDLDHWLKISNNDRTGPHVLEDQVGRERVC